MSLDASYSLCSLMKSTNTWLDLVVTWQVDMQYHTHKKKKPNSISMCVGFAAPSRIERAERHTTFSVRLFPLPHHKLHFTQVCTFNPPLLQRWRTHRSADGRCRHERAFSVSQGDSCPRFSPFMREAPWGIISPEVLGQVLGNPLY